MNILSPSCAPFPFISQVAFSCSSKHNPSARHMDRTLQSSRKTKDQKHRPVKSEQDHRKFLKYWLHYEANIPNLAGRNTGPSLQGTRTGFSPFLKPSPLPPPFPPNLTLSFKLLWTRSESARNMDRTLPFLPSYKSSLMLLSSEETIVLAND